MPYQELDVCTPDDLNNPSGTGTGASGNQQANLGLANRVFVAVVTPWLPGAGPWLWPLLVAVYLYLTYAGIFISAQDLCC